ncbi:MAG: leucyl-tRNA synthetase, leucyl-tRNA synthetase [Candidatus Peregrinibacteria bacterium GW2011_GWF2_38_29]|nr:MAG: leucyl-tRNA synthetase, leucyl-tRNA synthetase [Candidatus Peregrinibacteria bacterium GW2011_GWF2_38_29]HBB02359.1 leucine--tRNA ligase [Candidatus Peregrinibacteria bacterium]
MDEIRPTDIDQKWQKKWRETNLHNADFLGTDKPKYYNLVMFPYPSAAKLHIGHWYNYGGSDLWGRYMRMKGFNVFEPMGFDSFGLPAENYAVKTGVHPMDSTYENIKIMCEQLSAVGTMYDWDKKVVTSDPEYYKWTQWIFLKFFEAGLANRRMAPVNWCPKCQTCLANEQVKEGKCDRCSSEVVKKDMEQWFFNIKKYAERLLNFEGLDWPEKTKMMQKDWIGKSEGVNFKHKIKDLDIEFEVFDSIPQTFMAQTFVIIAPDHPLVKRLVEGTEHEKPVMDFVKKIEKKRLNKKFDIDADMEGVFTGRYSENYMGTGKDLPIWVASFALMDYGTGIVGCSAHDERDFAFAKMYNLPLHPVLFPEDKSHAEKVKNLEVFYREPDGILHEPKEFEGMKWHEARKPIIDHIEKKKFGTRTINYKLHDWLLSRQRYWGAPIPVVYCEKCKADGSAPGGIVAIPEKDLPVLLPRNVDFIPRGKSPLHYCDEFMKTTCPKCGGPAERESDTMDTFVDSSWYFLRYLSPKNEENAFDKKIIKKWMPVDMYIGGAEHACMHLIYARFFTMVLHDLGYIDFDEPFKRLVHQGTITKDSAKMSKSKGNVVSPDSFIEKYGSDVFRMYLMFIGPFVAGGDWSDKGITGVARFERKFKDIIFGDDEVKNKEEMLRVIHKTIKRVTESMEAFQFNTAIAAMMEFTNEIGACGIDAESKKTMVRLIAPFAPHTAEELWEKLDQKYSVFDVNVSGGWPKFDEKYLVTSVLELPVQINGKLRAVITVPVDDAKEKILECAKNESNVKKYFEGAQIVKEIYVPGKLVGFVVK